MSLATTESVPQAINVSAPAPAKRSPDKYRLLETHKHFSWKGKTFDLPSLIGEGAKLSVVVGSIDPTEKTGGALYHRLRRHFLDLEALGLMKFTGNWSCGDMLERPGNGVQPNSILITLTNRMQNSANFANSIPEGWKSVVNHYLPDEMTNAKLDPCHFCTRQQRDRVPAEVARHTKPEACRSCTRKKDPEPLCKTCTRKKDNRDLMAVKRSRGCMSCPVGVIREWIPSPCPTCTFWKNPGCTTEKRQCPHRLSISSRKERKNAAWKLRSIDGRKGKHHWMFVRKQLSDGKKIVQPALKARLDPIQTGFERYVDDVSKRVIVLRHREGHTGRHSQRRTESVKRDKVEHLLKDGNELVLDYQTRFTDKGRAKEEIKKFHDTWREAGINFDSAVFLTLTSDPQSDGSLWHVNRNFAPNWDEYLSLLTKRFRARRRDELILSKLLEIKQYQPTRWETINRQRRENREDVAEQLERLMAPICEKCTRVPGARDNVTVDWHKEHTPFTQLSKSDKRHAVTRIERKIHPYLGFTKNERADIMVNLMTKTLPDGTVIKESYRPVYLAVYEYMENGLLHSHITIFGTTWIDRMDQIKEDWDALGQGSMAHAYAMIKSPTGTWEWLGKPPQDSRNRQPVDYLIKYLIKGLYTKESHGMYWAMNKRFFTRSRCLDSGWVDYSDGESVWQLLASLHEDEIPMSIKKQQRGAPLLKAWYDAHGWQAGGTPGGGALA